LKQLFIHPYFDEDVDVLVCRLVRARGFAATTTQEAGRLGNTDSQQLAYATAHRQALVTHNRADFEFLAGRYFEQKKSHSGIIIAVRRPPQELSHRILSLLNSYTADEFDNQIRYI
jgi:predicted nuclease of predicted toxin-antitoxin system